jgi:hypothetical protein
MLIMVGLAGVMSVGWAACDKKKKKKTTPNEKKSARKGPRFKLTALHGQKVSLIKCKKPTDGKVVVFDINRDAKKNPDIWKVFRKNGTLACREMDMNYDGKRDLVIQYYRNGLDRQTMWQDQDFDGKFELVMYLRPDGTLEKTEMDTNSDGKIDVWKSYRINRDKDNVVFKIVQDRDYDGYRDYWERYDESGTIDEVSWTDSGDQSEKPRYWLSNPTPHETGVPKEKTKEPSGKEKKEGKKKARSG